MVGAGDGSAIQYISLGETFPKPRQEWEEKEENIEKLISLENKAVSSRFYNRNTRCYLHGGNQKWSMNLKIVDLVWTHKIHLNQKE